MLNDEGVAAACEADIYGALSMWIGMQLSNEPVFFGDPVALDEEESSITYWHCGAAACSLARKDTGAVVGVHPNRKIGPAMDFGCEAFPSSASAASPTAASASLWRRVPFWISPSSLSARPSW